MQPVDNHLTVRNGRIMGYKSFSQTKFKVGKNFVHLLYYIYLFISNLMEGKVGVPPDCQVLCEILVETNKIKKTCLFDNVSLFFYAIVPDSHNLAQNLADNVFWTLLAGRILPPQCKASELK